MKQEQISALQLFYVMLGFEIGNTLIFSVGAGAKQDAWLAILVSMLGGIILMGVYIKLSSIYPEDTLIQMLPKIIGKYLAYPVIVLYIFYFTFLASTACRDFAELILSTILPNTPMVVIIGCFVMLIIYCLRGGIESFGRMGELMFPVYILVMFAVWILILITNDEFDLQRLKPVLGEGWKPVMNEVFPFPSPSILVFPFGETVLILMFFPFLSKVSKAKTAGFAVIIAGGILLALNAIVMISVLGPHIYKEEFFPLLAATRMVSIADFLERFDAVIILLMVAGVFLKVGGWTFGASVAIAQLFHIKNYDSIALALGALITPFSIILATNFVQFRFIGSNFIDPYLHVPLQIVIPIGLLVIAMIRKKSKT
ncbi:endospore germination permease [Paenibacillus sp. GCM10023248]|uniref:GerAB/ArcD/ProY family transporter n=1 Tax=Bacillales TaxID=1385 RepID=UPI002379DFD6|nr:MULTISPECIES: endospore germination permease [Bacillales]MDD9268070.1 endospore germination permease [Paenibacillus sp. MAHUQ-63]MDR6879744.1 spore germination protein KB [Bacillus sp. 3255]